MKKKTVSFPHLGYKIFVYTGKNLRLLNKKGMVMACRKINSDSCEILMRKKPKMEQLPTVAHEALHAIQFMSEARHLDMIQEQEGTAYSLQYLINSIMGYHYVTKK